MYNYLLRKEFFLSMKRSEKFRQANREAKATILSAIAVIVFWWAAGFALADVRLSLFGTPLWVWGGCVGTWIFAILVTVFLTKNVFLDFDLNDEEAAGVQKGGQDD